MISSLYVSKISDTPQNLESDSLVIQEYQKVPKVDVAYVAFVQIHWMVVVSAIYPGFVGLRDLKHFRKKLRLEGKAGLVQVV
jgi:hypothetical protein